MPTKAKVNISGWTRFDSFKFSIAPGLAGAEHRFTYRGHQIVIRLPKRPAVNAWGDHDGPMTCSAWRVRGGRKQPLCFEVHRIDVLITTTRQAQVFPEALGRVDTSRFTKVERLRFDRISKVAEGLLESAFEYWLSVLRWKSGYSTLCQFTHTRRRNGWGVYLMETETEKRFYCPPRVLMVRRSGIVDASVWRDVGRTVSAHESVPIWRRHYIEAEQKLRLGDQAGFILDMAIASETIIRQLVTQLLRDRATPGFKRLIGSLGLTRILDDWLKIGFGAKSWREAKRCRVNVKKVVELRNIIMHRGNVTEITSDEAHALREGVACFLRLGEREIDRRRRL